MPSLYPYQIDSSINLITAQDLRTPVSASIVNNLRDAIIAVESALGLNPAGTFGTVRARLDAVDLIIDSIIAGGGATIGGDLFPTTAHSQTVIGLQGRPVSNALPFDGYFLAWSSVDGYWEPRFAPAGTFAPGGDLTGNSVVQVVGQRKAFLLMGA